jgi:hypothetical protein
MPKPLRDMGLKDLVDFAYRNKWIEHDAKLASELVRYYRNLVHPLAEKRTGHSLNRDTVDITGRPVQTRFFDGQSPGAEPLISDVRHSGSSHLPGFPSAKGCPVIPGGSARGVRCGVSQRGNFLILGVFGRSRQRSEVAQLSSCARQGLRDSP